MSRLDNRQREGTGGARLPRLLRWLSLGLALMLLAMAVGCVMVRTAGHDVARWHVDPATTARTGKPNDFLAAPEGASAAQPDRILATWALAPGDLLTRFDAVVRAAPRTEVVAGTPEALFVTYVQRSALIGFPDYISVRAIPVQGGASLVIWSRSRYGYSDLGVNRARVEGWLEALGPSE
ncbi:MAG: DUF1499 domain-containing protein [Pseudomonadota bacterium]